MISMKNNPLWQEHIKWEKRADIFRFSSIVLIFVGLFGLSMVDKETAKWLVWYWAGLTFIVGTVGFILGNISIKKLQEYFDDDLERLERRLRGE